MSNVSPATSPASDAERMDSIRRQLRREADRLALIDRMLWRGYLALAAGYWTLAICYLAS